MIEQEIIEYLNSITSRDNSQIKIDTVFNELVNFKNKYIKENNQDKAKKIWCYEQILMIQNNYLNAYNKIKGKYYYDGWVELERCEINLRFLSSHFIISDDKYYLKSISKRIIEFQSLYPYRVFLSPEMLVKKVCCSICGKKISIRNSCGHRVGEIYNGIMCHRNIEEVEFLGIAIVDSPVQKYSVLFMTDEKTGKKVDNYNYGLLDYLMKRLPSPFHDWEVICTNKRHPHSMYSTVGRNDLCPCGSKKTYEQCCLKESGVLRPHFQFTFSFPVPKELMDIEYH